MLFSRPAWKPAASTAGLWLEAPSQAGKEGFYWKIIARSLAQSTASYKNISHGYSEHADNPQSLKEMQGSNFDGTPQIHFRNEGFSPAEHCSPVLWRREEGREKEGVEGERGKKRRGERRKAGRGEERLLTKSKVYSSARGPPSRKATLDMRGFLPCTHTQERARWPPEEEKAIWSKSQEKKKKRLTTNLITVKFQGALIFFWYQILGTLHISLYVKQKKKEGAEPWNSITQEVWEVFISLMK